MKLLALFLATALASFAQTPDTNAPANVGNTVILTVSVSTGSNLSYEWMKGGVKLADTAPGVLPSLVGSNTFRLTVAKVTLASAGTYTVRVFNSSGSTLSNNGVVTVTAVAPPPAGATISAVVTP